jgi:catechol 2,3-dioxygenase-like lactoylglutathione lyase family enzyme
MNDPRPRLDQINIVSGNLDASIAFYRQLGVDIPEDGIWRTPSGIHHVTAGGDTTDSPIGLDIDSIAFAQRWNRGWQGRENLQGRVVIGFTLPSRDSVDLLYAKLTGAGHPGLCSPWDAFWGSRYAIVEDPDGIAVGLMSPPSAGHRSAPPDM